MNRKFHSGRGQNALGKHLYMHSGEKENGIFLECGALDGVSLSVNKDFEEGFGWKCVNVEANPKSFSLLVENRPNCTNLNYALSSVDGEEIMISHNRKRPKLSHVTKKEDLKKERKRRLTHFSVETITYRTLIEQIGLTELDVFVLDIEGHELEAIKGMEGCEVLPKVFCIEQHGRGKRDQEFVDALGKLSKDYELVENLHYNFIYKMK
jgi:FkbM family methyltransferase